MSDRLGWLFCEIAFRLFERIPDGVWPAAAERPRGLRWRACNALACRAYELGTWFYRRAA